MSTLWLITSYLAARVFLGAGLDAFRMARRQIGVRPSAIKPFRRSVASLASGSAVFRHARIAGIRDARPS